MPVVVSEPYPRMSATPLKLAPLHTMVVANVWRRTYAPEQGAPIPACRSRRFTILAMNPLPRRGR